MIERQSDDYLVFSSEEGSLPFLGVEVDKTETRFGIMYESYSLDKTETLALIDYLKSAVERME